MKYEVDGNLDAGFVDNFRTEFDALAQAQEDVVLNLSRVSFVDSCGIGALVALHRKLLARGYRLKVLGLRGQPLQLFINLELVPLFCGNGKQSPQFDSECPK
jgi:anti-anti-sigma factor